MINVHGVFSKKGFPLNDENKKMVSEGIRDAILRVSANLAGRIRFDSSDESVTFSAEIDGDEQEKRLIAVIERAPGVKATPVDSSWDLLVARRATMLGNA
jgi:osmotically-inducible protein OsmY